MSTTTTATSRLMAWWVWLIAVLFVVFLFSFQTGYAIVNSAVKAELGISVAQIGAVAATYTWVFAFCQLFGGSLLDKFGARKVLVPAIALVTTGVFVFAHAQSFPQLLLSQVILAVGACVGFVGAGYVGGVWFGWARFSFMFGLVQFSASLFSAFNQNLILFALQSTPWRNLFNMIGFMGTGLFLLALVYLRNPPMADDAPKTSQDPESTSFMASIFVRLLEVARIRQVWVAAAVGALCFGTMLSLGVVWAPKLLHARGIEAGIASSMASLLWLGLAVGCVVIPWCSDHFKARKWIIIVGVLVQGTAITALVYLPSVSHAGLMVLCFVFGFANAVHMLAFSVAGDIVPPQLIGTSAAIVNGSMFLLAGVLMSRIGDRASALIEAGATDPMIVAHSALQPVMIAMLLALLLSFILKETYRSGI